MTNKEYIEKNNISFSEAMKLWNNQTNHIEDWLNQEHSEWKFKSGDILAFCGTAPMTFRNDHVYFVIDSDDKYLYIKEYTRYGKLVEWCGEPASCTKYTDTTINIIRPKDQHYFKKIF